MMGEQQTINTVPEAEIGNVARAWASSYGYAVKEPLTIVPLLALVPDGRHIMSARLEGWTIFAQAEQRATGREVTITFALQRLAGCVVPDEEPLEC